MLLARSVPAHFPDETILHSSFCWMCDCACPANRIERLWNNFGTLFFGTLFFGTHKQRATEIT